MTSACQIKANELRLRRQVEFTTGLAMYSINRISLPKLEFCSNLTYVYSDSSGSMFFPFCLHVTKQKTKLTNLVSVEHGDEVQYAYV